MALRGHNLPVLGSPAAGTSCWPDPVRCIDILCRCERVQDELDRFNTDIKILNQDYAAGINRPQWHGTPYKVTFNGANSAWPGWEFQHGSPLGWGAFDPRQAYWGDVHELTGYVSRTQTVLQTGVAKADLLVLRGTNQSFSAPSSSSNSLQTLMNAGWTYARPHQRWRAAHSPRPSTALWLRLASCSRHRSFGIRILFPERRRCFARDG